MNTHDEILAKSPQNGGISIYRHALHVAEVAVKAAEALRLDCNVARCGAYLHDIGKVHPDFQRKLSGIKDITQAVFRHEIASILFLPLFKREMWEPLTDMVIAHHRSPKEDGREQGILDLIQFDSPDAIFKKHAEPWEEWSGIACEILSVLGIHANNITIEQAREAFDFAIDYCKSRDYGWSKYKGLLMGADSMASGLLDNTSAVVPELFKIPDLSFFGSKERVSGVYPLSLINADDPRPHTLLSAPTGSGKTDFLLRRCSGRVFYALPFQASINAMYGRLKERLPESTDIRLLHAASRIVTKGERKYEEVVLQPMIGSSVKVLTPHQLASLICATRGFESIAIDIAGCDVVLDEIHSYSDEARAMVFELIKVLKLNGCRIHIGTATMPSSLTEAVTELLGGEENIYSVKLPAEELNSFDRHRIIKHGDEKSAFEILGECVAGKQKILIVCNRVAAAQKRYSELKERYPDVPAMLLHSRFRRKDRNALERELIDKFNNRAAEDSSCIVVSTQVVEVSLDIDFDVMITDAAPIDALIQRFGRINRKRTPETIEAGIIKDIHVISLPKNKGDCLPYCKEVVERSFEALPDNGVLYENEIQAMIDNVFPGADLTPIGVHLVWEDGEFLLKELLHRPYSYLHEKLDFESASCILQSDAGLYEKGHSEQRLALEIPVPVRTLFRRLPGCERAKFGYKPLIIPDRYYSPELGLHWNEIDNII